MNDMCGNVATLRVRGRDANDAPGGMLEPGPAAGVPKRTAAAGCDRGAESTEPVLLRAASFRT